MFRLFNKKEDENQEEEFSGEIAVDVQEERQETDACWRRIKGKYHSL